MHEKLKPKRGFDFERGNSGSPVICKSSGKVIAMLSNKEGSNVGYAIEISNLTEVWSGLPSNLLKKQIPINYLSKLIEIVKVKKGIVVALLTLIAIYLLSPYVLTIKKLHSIEEEIIRLHGESNQTIQDKAPKYAEELTVKIKDKYLFSIAYKIAKYQDILNSYTLAASVETDKKQQILLSQKAIDAWEITTKFIQQAKSENNRWVLEENVEEDSNLMVATAMAIEAKASGDIEKTRNKFLELNIEHWYNRYIKRNEKEREPNIEWFLKNHSNQKEMQ
ncbi:MAG: hypothetical protein K0U38_03100 [Epsilonproteobacteria bacterium]|nr:hypothetical protein [Campylobacterota bacterium]